MASGRSSASEPLAWLNGEFIPHRDAKIPVWDMGIVQAVTVTEAIRTFRHLPFRLEQHLARLRGSMDAVGISPAESIDDLARLTRQLIDRNSATQGVNDDVAAIVFATAGESLLHSAGLTQRPGWPTVCIYTYPLALKSAARAYREGISLIVPGVRHIPPTIVDPRIKTRSRLHWHLADREVRRVDPHAEALLLDLNGFATETAKGNLLVVVGKSLLTPLADTTLAGISQKVVEELAPGIGLDFERTNLTPDQLLAADELWISSTTTCLVPVTRLNGQPIGAGLPGPVWRRMIDAWSQLVGIDIVGQAELAAGEPAAC
jgi:branched-chain amino acid aminotransferase